MNRPGAASGLAWGEAPLPRLAEQAVHEALAKLGRDRADAILLYLTPDFARDPSPALRAAARAGACLQVTGGLVHHPFTEQEAVLDHPAAAALVLSDLPDLPASLPRLTYRSHHPAARHHWEDGPRFGIECAPGPLWAQGRLQEAHEVGLPLPGLTVELATSHGLQLLAPPLEITAAQAHQLLQVGHSPALESLCRALPPEQRERPALHTLFVVPPAGPQAAVRILEALPDGRLILATPLPVGTPITWAARQPLAAETELQGQLHELAERCPAPLFGLMFACIGRGPWFHGGEERNLSSWQQRFAHLDLPLLGAYGDSQISPGAEGGARLIHNSVVTALIHPST
ncbi:FIST C-terminal domain-containing protein [Azovibrio restrictus]|uniref:FIST C-terminal domain-containing protein n=1 Tax=Azovibrio restrictus TaxID=146938 RepID=UPI0026F31D21|nr:FIST C-terminal domain-containing protein [Azovibrio restrictus]